MIIYSNSCSYGVHSDGPVYSDLVAKNLHAELINHGLSGSCNERIFRTTVRDILNILGAHKSNDVLVLIGLTNTFRSEYWSTLPGKYQDGHFRSFTVSDQSGEAKNYQQEFYKMYDQEAAITNLLHQLVMLTGFLKSQKVKYLIWTNTPHLTPIDFDADFVQPFYKSITQDADVLTLFDFNFCEFARAHGHPTMDQPYEQGGHPNAQAHKDFADFLMTKINL